jgi:acyl-coenzyme A synthetase/AMP-(fatty) acid ligase
MFGTSAAYISACMKAGEEPRAGRDLSALRSVGSTGSPLAPEGFDWVYEQLGDHVWLFSTSGGTDLCTAFVGGVPTLPVYRGELQARALGAAVESWDPEGRPHIGVVARRSSTAARTRPSTAAASASAPPRSTAPCWSPTTSSTPSSSTSRRRGPTA